MGLSVDMVLVQFPGPCTGGVSRERHLHLKGATSHLESTRTKTTMFTLAQISLLIPQPTGSVAISSPAPLIPFSQDWAQFRSPTGKGVQAPSPSSSILRKSHTIGTMG